MSASKPISYGLTVINVKELQKTSLSANNVSNIIYEITFSLALSLYPETGGQTDE